jgi:hypothetical protein
MTKLSAFRTAVAGVIALGTLVTSAQAATIIKPIAGGPFSGLNPIGAFPVMALLKADTYDFTFTLAPPLVGDTQTQLEAQVDATPSGETISYKLFSGTPTGAHAYIATSPVGTSSVLDELLTPGSYFVQITPAQIAVNKEVDSGSLTTASVPEPASWAMMLLGFSLAGGVLRRQARRPIAL